MRACLVFLIFCAAAPLAAAEWAFRDADRVLSRTEVEELTTGQTLVFYDEGRSTYSAGGSYSYTYASGQSAFGQYTIAEDGTVCIAYRNGSGRCDRYVQNENRIILLTESGLRFPIRPPDNN